MLTYYAILSTIALLFDIFYKLEQLYSSIKKWSSNEETFLHPWHLKGSLSWFEWNVNLLSLLSDVRLVVLISTNYYQNTRKIFWLLTQSLAWNPVPDRFGIWWWYNQMCYNLFSTVPDSNNTKTFCGLSWDSNPRDLPNRKRATCWSSNATEVGRKKKLYFNLLCQRNQNIINMKNHTRVIEFVTYYDLTILKWFKLIMIQALLPFLLKMYFWAQFAKIYYAHLSFHG